MKQGRMSLRCALVISALLLAGSVTAVAATEKGDADVAYAAKKKCKKAHRGVAVAKKQCKKKRKPVVPVPSTPVTPLNPVTSPVPASLSISPTSHNFGTVFGDSGDGIFTVTNSGGSPTGTLSTTLGGNDPGNFVISTDACDGTVLGADAACTVDVHCSNPEFNGVTRTATVTVTGSPGGSPYATLTCFETT
ncbi:MAG TPA: hypothetical protein VFN72_06435 [Solirubrobacterales bacterium]|nr:hypothetical protein [Solirubrobacterales bacterium]